MDKYDNLQTSSEDRQYYIPMEVTPETVRDFGIDPADVVWTKIGNKPKKVIMVPATKEQYYEYMRPLWREDKREQRLSKTVSCEVDDVANKERCKEWQKRSVSLDELFNNTEYEVADTSDLEADVMKKMLIDELHKVLDGLEEIDRTIMDMYGANHSEAEIGRAIGMSQKGVNKRKHRILLKLKTQMSHFK
jgi:RNA polymerase sigma factor (sigma-70 family)